MLFILKNNIHFDKLYGWEKTLLEPTEFWKKVPPRWKNDYHFFNGPVSSNMSNPDHPLQSMVSMGVKESDFVSFKLDIDTPAVEIPLVLQLNASSEFISLVDEFFFELHFNCELMKKYWKWGKDKVNGFTMDRPSTLKLFSDLRHQGIRAHFWP